MEAIEWVGILVQQIRYARSLGLVKSGSATVEVSLHVDKLYLLSKIDQPGLRVSWREDEATTFIGAVVEEDLYQQNWTQDEIELGFAVKLKLPTMRWKQPKDKGDSPWEPRSQTSGS